MCDEGPKLIIRYFLTGFWIMRTSIYSRMYPVAHISDYNFVHQQKRSFEQLYAKKKST